MMPAVSSDLSNDFLLQVRRLRTLFPTSQGVVAAVDDVTFGIRQGETLGLVGESGCGKTTAGMSILRLVAHPGEIVAGEILFEKANLLELSLSQMRSVRGRQIAMVCQEPVSALDPTMKVGTQLIEGLREHFGDSRGTARQKGVGLLRRTGLKAAAACMTSYPHQLSGGMCQRVLIAMALSCQPRLLIADEPTTALDAGGQAQVLQLLRELRTERGLAVLMISHDFAVLAGVADWIGVMYAGQIVEYGPADEILQQPSHPYTQRLLASVRGLHAGGRRGALPVVEGSVPDMARLPSGCRFHPRCLEAEPGCQELEPELRPIPDRASSHSVRCLLRETRDPE